MRSSKPRSRSKSNRQQRSVGNVINRVFDSSGPDGKVRGTPQQIIEKYLQLARDAQLSHDRVAEQSFFQHAEHYTRMLSEAVEEMAREQEARQGQQSQGGYNQQGGNNNTGQNNGNSGQNNGNYGGQNNQPNNQQGGGQGNQQGGGQDQPQQTRDRGDRPDRQRQDDRPDRQRQDDRPDRQRNDDRRSHGAADVIDTSDDDRGGLVETPEARPVVQPAPSDAAADPGAERSPAPRSRGLRRPKGDKPETSAAE